MTSPAPTSDPVPDPLRRRALTALVFAGGDALAAADHDALRIALGHAEVDDPVVIAADSGLHEAQDGGWAVDVVLGDLDSVDPARLARAEAAGARVERHPAAKDETDLELALGEAAALGVAQVVLAGGNGGRLDHLLANVLLLADDRFAPIAVSARLGSAWIHVVRHGVAWSAPRGDLVTLLPLHGAVTGVTTAGLLYPLAAARLGPGTTRGVSNEQLEPWASVTVASGVLAVVRPGAAGTHVLAAAAAADPAPSAPPVPSAPVAGGPAAGRPRPDAPSS